MIELVEMFNCSTQTIQVAKCLCLMHIFNVFEEWASKPFVKLLAGSEKDTKANTFFSSNRVFESEAEQVGSCEPVCVVWLPICPLDTTAYCTGGSNEASEVWNCRHSPFCRLNDDSETWNYLLQPLCPVKMKPQRSETAVTAATTRCSWV